MGNRNSELVAELLQEPSSLDESQHPRSSMYINVYIPKLYQNLLKVEEMISSHEHLKYFTSRHNRLVIAWERIQQALDPLESNLSVFCSEEWEDLKQYNHGFINSHIIAVMASTFIDPEFKDLDLNDKSILMWACLFHDIAKRGRPYLKGKDPIHPFTSTSKTLGIFNRIGWIIRPELVQQTMELINKSGFVHEKKEYMDNRNLPEIYSKLLYVTGITNEDYENFTSYQEITKEIEQNDKSQLFVFEILALILLHQSVDLYPRFPNYTPLDKDQIIKFLSPRLLKLLSILHKGDNASYNLRYPQLFWRFSKPIERTTRKFLKYFRIKSD